MVDELPGSLTYSVLFRKSLTKKPYLGTDTRQRRVIVDSSFSGTPGMKIS